MKITEVVLERIKDNQELDAYVKGAVSKISKHITSNKMIFFPEYTDHDITHFEAVLETAVDLATEKSRELMSDVDFALLTTSVMLHDLGMHLTKDGFCTLISADGPLRPIEGFGDRPWNELWVSFLAEARRFDANKLESLFGTNYKPVTTFPSFDDPWDEFDILLVGEFLRRHHPRLAHEIALQGLPSIDGSVVRLCQTDTDYEKFLSDIGGLVARSHGMGLRQTFSYLESKYNNKIETRSAHPIYLMSLLRIADYLQIQSERAPAARTQVSKFNSPISTREWSVHQCVSDITNLTDPEAIDITAQPEDVATFLRLKYWVEDLQRELDITWAILGEVYGLHSHSGLNKLGLHIRRIKSNIDDAEGFAKTINYIPERIAFETSGSELLKLLVGPLYSNDISVGLRELVQNATDAVKELDQLVLDGSIDEPKRRADVIGDVQIDFELSNDQQSGAWTRVTKIVVIDRGVGMTQDIIKNYFLMAGASFRSSDAWKEKFERPDGLKTVQRSGRFGVGALAAFLLGDKITVETRHYSEPTTRGLKFSAGIETGAINVLRHDCEVGTKIQIEVPERLQTQVGKLLPSRYSKEVSSHQPISQYFGRYPKLVYTEDGKEIPWDEKCYLPSKSNRYEDPWNYFETENFEVNWSYEAHAPDLAVNQIRVSGSNEERFGPHNIERSFSSSIFNLPSLSIGDNSGSFPLNLQRNSYASKELSFADEILADITDEFVFSCLWQMSEDRELVFPRYRGQNLGPSYDRRKHVWLRCSDGVILNNAHFLNCYTPRYALMRYGGRDDASTLDQLIVGLPAKSLLAHDANDEFSGRKFTMKGKLTRTLQGQAIEFISQSTTALNVFIPSSFVDLIKSKMKPGQSATKLLDGLEKDVVDGWMIQRGTRLSEPEAVHNWRKTLKKDGSDTSVIGFHELSNYKQPPKKNRDVVVFDRWIELVGVPYLPNSKVKVDQLLTQLREKLGEKYEIFERRAYKAMQSKKKRAEGK
ncbi:ATP-binding protein [uncultured Shimia sp.]|uniref:HD domain-containing protein n=1 Tax=uncultured Shimia sp. TaxID=573152 RepID=UPI0025E78A6D|nr:ATP-binding protein [uncultured Shimia sp.]